MISTTEGVFLSPVEKKSVASLRLKNSLHVEEKRYLLLKVAEALKPEADLLVPPTVTTCQQQDSSWTYCCHAKEDRQDPPEGEAEVALFEKKAVKKKKTRPNILLFPSENTDLLHEQTKTDSRLPYEEKMRLP